MKAQRPGFHNTAGKPFFIKNLSFSAICLFLLSACSIPLTADVTPPPGEDQTPILQIQSTSPSGSIYPLAPPDPANGQAIFNEKCASCHGASGQGDGPRANELPNPVPALGSAEKARQATPAEWFSTVTQGNLDRSMPPFPSLSDSQRWDVVAYALLLSTSNTRINQGQELYQNFCTRCHGEQGKGDGQDASGLTKSPRNLADLAYMADKSAMDMYQLITVGVTPDMPSFNQLLTDDQRWMLVDYLRLLTFSISPVAQISEPTPTIETTSQPKPTPLATASIMQELGTITGKVINGSGGTTPMGLTVTLHGLDDIEQVITRTTTTQADGSFVFKNVEMIEGRVFLTSVDFSQTTYNSDVSVVPPNLSTLYLPITVYETITDTTVIKVDRLHLFFEMLDENTMRVVELYIMSNTTNKTLVAAQKGQPVFRYKLPVGSSNLEFQDGVLGERYLETPDGFGDTMPVPPGSGNYQVLFALEMPYNRKLDFVQPVLHPVDAVVVLVPEGDIKIKSDMFRDDGTRNIQGTIYHMFSSGSVEAGQDLRLTAIGHLGGNALAIGMGTRNNLIIGFGVFGLALILAGVWLYRHTQIQEVDDVESQDLSPTDPTPENIEALMDAIIALDDLYQTGELPEEAYRQRRSELKARLKLLKEAQGTEDLSGFAKQ
jgi:mono/diheme cytochrome c family protein